jgi:membrane-bound lytic murein transglycosylase F
VKSFINKILAEKKSFQITVFLIWALAVLFFINPIVNTYKFATLKKIQKFGELTIVTRNSPHCYYLYRDTPMGFEYELAKAFADYLGVKLRVKIAEGWERMVPALMDGTGAVIAAGTPMTSKRQSQVAFANGYMKIQQHVIVHRNNSKIKKIEDLSGKVIHVRRGTAYQERLEYLRQQGIDFSIQLYEDVPTEELIQRVAEKEVDFTVADNNVALLNRRHYPAAVMAAPISQEQYLGWAVHPESRELLASINTFFQTIQKNGKFEEIYNKYYGNLDEFDYVDLRAFHRRIKSRLSRYSPFIKAAAKKHGFDWRMIAAQAYQESHLNPWAKSRAGAKGLMQLLPRTAKSLGVKDVFDPVQNINAGVKYLKKLYGLFDQAHGKNRLLLSLAAYNIGQGHIEDARKLAVQLALDPNLWESIAKTLPLLTYRKYHKNAKYGYCRGTEPVIYIKQILIYYDILKHQGADYRATQANYKGAG